MWSLHWFADSPFLVTSLTGANQFQAKPNLSLDLAATVHGTRVPDILARTGQCWVVGLATTGHIVMQGVVGDGRVLCVLLGRATRKRYCSGKLLLTP